MVRAMVQAVEASLRFMYSARLSVQVDRLAEVGAFADKGQLGKGKGTGQGNGQGQGARVMDKGQWQYDRSAAVAAVSQAVAAVVGILRRVTPARVVTLAQRLGLTVPASLSSCI